LPPCKKNGKKQKNGTVIHDAALSPGDDEIKQSNFMAGENLKISYVSVVEI
jgi:hypothetical protein